MEAINGNWRQKGISGEEGRTGGFLLIQGDFGVTWIRGAFLRAELGAGGLHHRAPGRGSGRLRRVGSSGDTRSTTGAWGVMRLNR